MNATLTFEQPAWLIILCLALGVVYSLILYYRHSFIKDPSPKQKLIFRGLSVLRALVVAFLAILLLSPLIRTDVTETQDPVVVVLQDNSESIANSMSSEDSTQYSDAIKALKQELGTDMDVKLYGLENGLIEKTAFDLNGKMTDLSKAMSDVYGLYGSQNLGGIILATDGIYNQGSNPYYVTQRYAQFPVYTVALGDTVPQKDRKIDKVYYNDIVYLEDRFKVEVDLLAQNMPGNTKALIYDVTDGGTTEKGSANVTFTDGNLQKVGFVLEANKPGIRHYRIALRPIDGEFTTSNNYRDIFVDVLDSRQKVLILAQAPHPDIAAIREAATSNKNYEVDLKYSYENLNINFKDYDLVVLHQLPSKQQSAQQLVTDIKKAGSAIWFVLGSQSNINTFNSLQNNLQIAQSGQGQNEATALLNKDFSLFTISNGLSSQLSQFPPLSVPFGQYSSAAGSRVLLKQRIGSVSTDYPLLSFHDAVGFKTAVLAGEGIWRWRLTDFRFNNSHELFDELVTKTIQYLAVKQDKRRFKVKPTKNIFLENEAVEFVGELYNESYEAVNTPDVNIVMTDADGKEYPYVMSKVNNGYHLTVPNFKEGTYNYRATTVFNNETLSSSGQFTISPMDLEANTTVADHQLLYQMSEVSGGSMHSLADISSIADAIRANTNIKPVIYTTHKTEPFINLKWVFFVLLAFLSIEWFTRKYMGGY